VFDHGLYPTLQAEPGVIAEVHRRAGDALYSRRDYGAAVAEYCETVGQLEPSYVIRRFLDAQRIHNLAAYLAHLHAKVRYSDLARTYMVTAIQHFVLGSILQARVVDSDRVHVKIC
jgi:hypothetical protein